MAERMFNPSMHPDFSSPSGNVISAALAAARSTMSGPLPTTTHPPSSITPLPNLKHDIMMIAGVNVGGASSSSMPPIPHPVAHHTMPHPPASHPLSAPISPPITHPLPHLLPNSLPVHPTPPTVKQNRGGRQPSANGVQKRVRKKSREPARFFCQVADCSKAFRMQGDLHAHMRIHTGEEPFVCSFPFCGRKYKWRSSLAHHEGLHVRKKGALLQRRPRRSKVTSVPAEQEEIQQGQNSVGARDGKEEFEL